MRELKREYAIPALFCITTIYILLAILVDAANIRTILKVHTETLAESPHSISTIFLQKVSMPPKVREIQEEQPPLAFEEQVNHWIKEICVSYPSVNPYLVQSIVYHESRYVPSAKNYNGTCIGLMQISTKWHSKRASQLGVQDLFDPYGNLLVGIDLLSDILEIANYDEGYALMIYNMNRAEADRLYASGLLSSYARSVLDLRSRLEKEV